MAKKVLFILFLVVAAGCMGWAGYMIYNTQMEQETSEPSVKGLTEVTFIVHINNNWSDVAAAYGWCNGAGTVGNPYVIENLYMNCHNLRTGILINKTTEYFIIRNCTIFNAAKDGACIWLQEVDNGQILRNTAVNSLGGGIYLFYDCNNITVEQNEVKNNGHNGIYMSVGENNTFSNNFVECNEGRGIYLMNGDSNSVIGNHVKDNYYGISISNSNKTEIKSNALSMSFLAMGVTDSEDVEISDNDFQFNIHGVQLSNSQKSRVVDNDFILNFYAVEEPTDNENTVIANNTIEGLINGYTSALLFLLIALFLLFLALKLRPKKSTNLETAKKVTK